VTGSEIGIAVVNGSTENSLSGNSVAEAVWGFVLNSSDGNTLTDNHGSENAVGFVVWVGSDDNVLSRNQANSNTETGFWIIEGSSNTVVENRAFGNWQYGFLVADSLSEANVFKWNHACYNGIADAEFNDSSSKLVGNLFGSACGGNGAGELVAAFHATLGGGSVINSRGIADAVASPQLNPEGRIEPFGGEENICDNLVIGTWATVFDATAESLDAWRFEFSLDSGDGAEVLDTVRTPNKRIPQGDDNQWWFTEGVPVLGTLDPGTYDLWFGYYIDDVFIGGFNTAINVAAC
jgi:parallel beta-helix repeat protein